ncbi:MAG: putative Zn-dependent peptidase [Alphaproteobacteria bacterium]|jgi:predicted Zn-dependent peptidase
MSYHETKLANGLTVVSEHMAAVESASVGIYVRTGSRAETQNNNGVAHFLEHMAFKGTTTRTSEEIAREIEDVGGHINAYTSRETTAYHLKVLKEDLPLAVDILGDILQNSTFDKEEIEKERLVILQELGQSIDEPDEIVFENLQKMTYPDHPMGRSILGTEETVKGISADDLTGFMAEHYTADNMILSAVGNIDHAELVTLAEKHFSGLKNGLKDSYTAPEYTGGDVVEHRDLEQVHVVVSYEGFSIMHPAYYAANIWVAILGGGMASRLFQEVREKRGLAYSVYSYLSNHSDCGTFGIYAGTGKDSVDELINVIDTEIEKSLTTITDDELKRAKAQLIAGIRMAQESTDSRMGRIARNIFVYGRFVPLQEVIDEVEAVTIEAVQDSGKLLSNKETRALSILGPMVTSEKVAS